MYAQGAGTLRCPQTESEERSRASRSRSGTRTRAPEKIHTDEIARPIGVGLVHRPRREGPIARPRSSKKKKKKKKSKKKKTMKKKKKGKGYPFGSKCCWYNPSQGQDQSVNPIQSAEGLAPCTTRDHDARNIKSLRYSKARAVRLLGLAANSVDSISRRYYFFV